MKCVRAKKMRGAFKAPPDRIGLQSNELNKLTCKLEREFDIKLAEDVKSHSKTFWKYGNDNLKTRDKANDLLKEDGSLIKNDNEKAEVLNIFFKSVFTVEDTSQQTQLPEPHGMKVDQVLSTVEITPQIVRNKLHKLNKFSRILIFYRSLNWLPRKLMSQCLNIPSM